MGKDVAQGAFTRDERVRYRQKVRRCLDVFALMLDDFGFDADRPMTGLEIELNLVDSAAEPAMRNEEILADIADPPDELCGVFDAVVGFFVLHHVGDLARAFSGVSALLRPGGRAAFLEPNPLFAGYYVQVALTPGMSWRGEGGILRMRPRLLQGAAGAAGWRSGP